DMTIAFERHHSTEASLWSEHAKLRLYVGDTDGYRAACAQMCEQFSGQDPRTCWWRVSACTLAPNGVDPARLVELAETALASDRQSLLYRLWLGVAQYRAGRFEQALGTLEAVTQSDSEWTNSEAWPVLPMTHHRLARLHHAR